MDPGNWATNLAGGAKFGYSLLAVIIVLNVKLLFDSIMPDSVVTAVYRFFHFSAPTT